MRMLKNNLGYPRAGAHRELKKACESFWSGKTGKEDLLATSRKLKEENWATQSIDYISINL